MLPLDRGACQVWWARLDSQLTGDVSLLDPVEHARAGAYRREPDRRRFVVGVAVTRLVLAGLLGVPAAQVPLSRRCPRCAESHGRPHVPDSDLAFSVSHSGDRVVVAFVRDALVGVDVEVVDRSLDVDALAGAALAPAERTHLADWPAADRTRAFLTCWTRKEAVVKATGDGLATPLPGVVVSPAGERPALLAHAESPALVDSTTLAELHPGAGYLATLAVIGDPPSSITELDAEVLGGVAR